MRATLLAACCVSALAVAKPNRAAPAPAPVVASLEPSPVEPKPLVVATDVVAPFIMKEKDGSWNGISIDLWRLVANEMKLPFVIKQFSDDDAWQHPEKYGIDVLVSRNVTPRAERANDLTQPFYSTGLAIATRNEPKSLFTTLLSKMTSFSFIKGIGVLALVLLAMGFVVWRIERTQKPQYGGHPAKAVAHGAFWAFESLLGKADSLSKGPATRLVGLGWTLVTMLLVSGVTAKLSAELTLNQLSTTIAGPQDLPRVRVGATTASGRFLEPRGVRFKLYDDYDALLRALDKSEIEAAVGEAPILKYQVNRSYRDRLTVLPGTFANHGYAFGLVPGSPLRKKMNVAMLEITDGEQWKNILQRYLGDAKD